MKVYKYKTGHYSIHYIAQEWDIAKKYVLSRVGYRIEVIKIKEPFLGGTPTIYYHYVKELER